MYISLLNGRQHPAENMENKPDLGAIGPVIGPVEVTWTLGRIKIHSPCGSHFHFLPTSSDGQFIYIDGVHYADFEIWKGTERMIPDSREQGRTFLEFEDVQKLPEEPASDHLSGIDLMTFIGCLKEIILIKEFGETLRSPTLDLLIEFAASEPSFSKLSKDFNSKLETWMQTEKQIPGREIKLHFSCYCNVFIYMKKRYSLNIASPFERS